MSKTWGGIQTNSLLKSYIYPKFPSLPRDLVHKGQSSSHCQRQQFLKVGCTETGHCVKVSQSDQSIIEHNQIPLMAWTSIAPEPSNSHPEATTRRDGMKPNEKTTGHTGIPTNGRIEAFCTTSRVVAHRDIVQSNVPRLVQPRVQKAQSRLASIDPCIIEHGNKRRKGGRGARRASDIVCLTLVDDEEVPGLRSDVGETLSSRRC